MKKIIEYIAMLICITIIWISTMKTVIVMSNEDEKIKLLEQSLNEQIEEKQVYMNMLEEERSK